MKKFGNKIKKILKINPENFQLYLEFTSGLRGLISLESIFSKPKGLSAEILKGNMFEKCFIESGALAWPNGFELCPDAILQWMQAQGSIKKRSA